MTAPLAELLGTWYYAAEPNKCIAVTGIGIKDVKIMKSGLKWPLQSATVIDLSPKNYEFDLPCMSKETLPFILPVLITIGPDFRLGRRVRVQPGHEQQQSLQPITNIFDSPEDMLNLKKFSIFLSKGDNKDNRDSVIKGMIEGEARVLAASMTINDLFSNRTKFKDEVSEKIDEELAQFGLRVYNANIRELTDTAESSYFKNTVKKILSEAENQAKIDVAKANLKGDSESQEKETERLVRLAELQAAAKIGENKQAEEIAKSEAKLRITQAEQNKAVQITQIQVAKETQLKDLEMTELNNQAAVKTHTQELKAKILAEASVNADALLTRTKAEAEAVKMKADADLYQKQREAEGVKSVYGSEAEGLLALIKAFNGDNNAALTYLMSRTDTFSKLAKINADAIQGLKPQITVWNTSSADGQNGNGVTDVFRNIMQSIPPLFTTIQDQTGVKILPQYVDAARNQGKK
jgi:flotillin